MHNKKNSKRVIISSTAIVKRVLPPNDRVYYKSRERKRLISWYAGQKGLSVSAFFNSLFNEWQERINK